MRARCVPIRRTISSPARSFSAPVDTCERGSIQCRGDAGRTRGRSRRRTRVRSHPLPGSQAPPYRTSPGVPAAALPATGTPTGPVSTENPVPGLSGLHWKPVGNARATGMLHGVVEHLREPVVPDIRDVVRQLAKDAPHVFLSFPILLAAAGACWKLNRVRVSVSALGLSTRRAHLHGCLN